MDAALETSDPALKDVLSAVSWGSIAAGAVVTAAISLPLFALGVGLGLSSISPWTDTGVSASTFKTTAGVYLVLVAVMSSAIGGYLAARLRAKWIGVHTNEAYFRDTAHGFISWAFATLISAAVLGTATTHLLSGAGAALGQSARSVNPAQVYVDRLFRKEPVGGASTPTGAATSTNNSSSAAAAPTAAQVDPLRDETLRLWTSSYATTGALSDSDKAYVTQLVSARTGLSQPDAEKRVNDVIQQAKSAADEARRGAAHLAFWITAALLFGAFSASLAAIEGGQLRDGTWNDRRLVPRQL